MKLTKREEVHLLALFDDAGPLAELQEAVDRALPEAENPVDFFGMQLLYDGAGEIVDVDERLRQTGAAIGLDAAVESIHRLGGYAVPAHVLRAKYSLTSQLGFIPGQAGFDAVELSRNEWARRRGKLRRRLAGYPVVTGSDAHFLEDVGTHAMEVQGEPDSVAAVLRAVGMKGG
jgi:hypothetical protein